MWAEPLQAIFSRELRTLVREVEAYPDDETLWLMPPGIANSGGTLVLHVTGNLRHFIGRVIGHSHYVRDRDAEFRTVGLTRTELVAQIEATQAEVEWGLARLGRDGADGSFVSPDDRAAAYLSLMLLHLLSHFAYHLGQLDYHRRMVTGESGQVDAMSLDGLATGDRPDNSRRIPS